MKYVDSGHGKFPLISLIAILSVSLCVNLPGLAISPLMAELDKVFPHASHMEIQMLSILPNLIIIPFILLSGKLSVSKSKMGLLTFGLAVFVICAIVYLFAKNMFTLIWVSCLLGIGCGFIVPIAAGLIADNFTGKARMKQLGIKSALANFTLIFATIIVGWLGNKGWHLPFIVYLVPVIPLVLAVFMSRKFIQKNSKSDLNEAGQTGNAMPPQEFHFSGKQSLGLLWGLMALYFFATAGNLVITYYVPFRMQSEQFNSSDIGYITSLFFLGVTISGFIIPWIIRGLKHWSIFIALCVFAGGLYISSIFDSMTTYVVASLLIGLGYGVIQPVVYNKATYIAPDAKKATQYLSFVLTCNYIAEAATPFVITGCEKLFNIKSEVFPFWFSAIMVSLLALASLIFFKSYVFHIDMKNYEKNKELVRDTVSGITEDIN